MNARRFAIDVIVAIPAVFVACIAWNVAIDASLLWAVWRARNGGASNPSGGPC
jgi:hypothetical protein